MDKLFDNYYADYTTINGNLAGPKDLTIGAGHNEGYMQPVFTAGADIGLPKKETTAVTVTIDYLMNLLMYKNDYGVSGFEGTAKGPVSWSNGSTTIRNSLSDTTTTTTATLGFNDSKNTYHRIAPKLTVDKTVAEGLKVGVVIQVPITIATKSDDQYSETKTNSIAVATIPTNSADARTTTDTTVHTPGGITKSTAVTASPSVMIGSSYVLSPGRFTVNAGVRLDPTVLKYTKETKSRNGDGVRTTETITNGDGVVIGKTDTTTLANPPGLGEQYIDKSTVNTDWSSFGASIGVGFLLNFNENIALDFFANSGNLSKDWNIEAASVNVMLTFKF
jgi:hypothetical protein